MLTTNNFNGKQRSQDGPRFCTHDCEFVLHEMTVSGFNERGKSKSHLVADSGSRKNKGVQNSGSTQKANSKSGQQSPGAHALDLRDELSDGGLTEDHLSQNDQMEASSPLLNANIIDLVPKSPNSGSIKEALRETRCLSKDGENALIKNCARCGSIIFDTSDMSAVKMESRSFKTNGISPMFQLDLMFKGEREQYYSKLLKNDEVSHVKHKISFDYLKCRDDLANRIFNMAQKFKQRDRTAHIAIELMDRFFMDERANKQALTLNTRTQTVYLTACFLIASKYDEIDDKLVFINDVQRYYRAVKPGEHCPTYTELVETERVLMHFFEWSISFATPFHFLEMFLAQGVVFQNESQQNTGDIDVHQKLDAKCFQMLKDVVTKRHSFKNDGHSPSSVAALCVMKAREALGFTQWPVQLKIVTRQPDLELKTKFEASSQKTETPMRSPVRITNPVMRSKGKMVFADRRQSKQLPANAQSEHKVVIRMPGSTMIKSYQTTHSYMTNSASLQELKMKSVFNSNSKMELPQCKQTTTTKNINQSPQGRFPQAGQTNQPKVPSGSKMFQNYLKIKMRSEEKDIRLPGVSDLRAKNQQFVHNRLAHLSSTSASSNGTKFQNQHRLKEKSLDTHTWRRQPVVITSKLPKAFCRQNKSISTSSNTHRGPGNPAQIQESWYKEKVSVSSSSSALSDQFESSRDEFAGCQGIPSSNIKMYSHNQWNLQSKAVFELEKSQDTHLEERGFYHTSHHHQQRISSQSSSISSSGLSMGSQFRKYSHQKQAV